MMTADWLAAVKTATLGIDWSHCRFRYCKLRNVAHASNHCAFNQVVRHLDHIIRIVGHKIAAAASKQIMLSVEHVVSAIRPDWLCQYIVEILVNFYCGFR